MDFDIVTILYNVSHKIPLSTNISIYFFLTGISAASFLISSLAYVFGMERFKPAGRIGAILAPIVLFIAPIFLVIDLEQPGRFMNLFYMFNPRSPVSWGTILLTIYPINCLVYLWFIYKAEVEPKFAPIAGGSSLASAKTIPVSDGNAKFWMKFFGTIGYRYSFCRSKATS